MLLCCCGNRTDNAIKNHWNSSVKKKLDSYLASGLLTQLQTVPLIGDPNQPTASSSSRLQRSGDDNGPRGNEVEEVSQCSQESANAGYFPSSSEMSIVVVLTGEEYRRNEESNLGRGYSPSEASCSEPYYMSLDDFTGSLPDIPCQEVCSSQFIEQKYSNESRSSTITDCQFNLQTLPNVSSLDFGQESSQLQIDFIAPSECHNMMIVPFQSSVDNAKGDNILMSDDECCRILCSEAMSDELFSSRDYNKGENTVDLSGCPSSLGQSSLPSIPSIMPEPISWYIAEASQLEGSDNQQFVSREHGCLIYANDISSSSGNDMIDSTAMQEPSDVLADNPNLVYQVEEKPNVHTEQEEAGTLCYEPPRFPSLERPFLSCDLVQSGGDMQQEFSPLGIRQFMMSSMNCLTPLRLWDSPRNHSPDALLKSAAKTFANTPSIVKKRRRSLLSPLSDKPMEKKLEIDTTSTLIKNFSRLDVMFDDNETPGADSLSPSSMQKRNSDSTSIEDDKENHGQDFKVEQIEDKNNFAIVDNIKSEKDAGDKNSRDNIEQPPFDSDTAEIVSVILP